MDDYLEMRHITKRFHGVTALDDVSLKVRAGTVHALLGENGAGKSTLMKILCGQYQSYDGSILLNGQPVRFGNAGEAIDAGISIVSQELTPLPDLTVGQNIFIGREPRIRGPLLDWTALYRDARKALSAMEMDLDPRTPMRALSVAQTQMVEIIKATTMNSRIIIMDEPTSALTESETGQLFAQIRRLKRDGITFIYITHKLAEVHQICDDITVLRDGRAIGSYPVEGTDEAAIISHMVGREIDNIYPVRSANPGEPVLEVRELTRRGAFSRVSFSVRRGEILGVAGMMGAGRSEVMSAVFGLLPYDSGEIELEGRPLAHHSCRTAIREGIVMVSEDRKETGVVLEQPILDNIALPNMNLYSRKGWVLRNKLRRQAREICGKLELKASSLQAAVNTLSGGNQQKVVLAKWLVRDIKLLIMDEPTRGIDVGAKHEIYKIMADLSAQGIPIVMISSEMPEVLGMSDRILVMADGRVMGECENRGVTQEQIMSMIVGGKDHA